MNFLSTGATKFEGEVSNNNQVTELHARLQHLPKGASIYEVDAELAQKMNEARMKYMKHWIKQ